MEKNASNDRTKSSQLEFAVESGNVQELASLLENGANPNETIDPHPRSALCNAIYTRDKDLRRAMVEILLKHGANPRWVDSGGAGVLTAAVIMKDEIVVELLSAFGADCRLEVSDGEELFAWAISDYMIDTDMPHDVVESCYREGVDEYLVALCRAASAGGYLSPAYLLALRKAHGVLPQERKKS